MLKCKAPLSLFIVLSCLGVYLNADDYTTNNYRLMEHNEFYRKYCIDGYAWIYFNRTSTDLKQMFEYHNGQSVPVKCK